MSTFSTQFHTWVTYSINSKKENTWHGILQGRSVITENKGHILKDEISYNQLKFIILADCVYVFENEGILE